MNARSVMRTAMTVTLSALAGMAAGWWLLPSANGGAATDAGVRLPEASAIADAGSLSSFESLSNRVVQLKQDIAVTNEKWEKLENDRARKSLVAEESEECSKTMACKSQNHALKEVKNSLELFSRYCSHSDAAKARLGQWQEKCLQYAEARCLLYEGAVKNWRSYDRKREMELLQDTSRLIGEVYSVGKDMRREAALGVLLSLGADRAEAERILPEIVTIQLAYGFTE